ncbi:type IV pilin protein [Candidatus Omnitrophota bacterium]
MKIRGFSLLEMIVVIVVVGILAGISLPQINKAMQRSRQAEAISILVRMYRGYKTAIAEGVLIPYSNSYMLYNYNDYGTKEQDWSRCFNPDESNKKPNKPSDRSADSWAALGFEQNPNYETTGLYFSYDFLKPATWPNKEDHHSTGSDPRTKNGIRPGSVGPQQNIGVAWLKTGNTQDGDEFYPIYDEPDGKWIFIDMDTGKITKGSFY